VLEVIVTEHAAVASVTQLVAERVPRFEENEAVTPWALGGNCTVMVDVVVESAGIEAWLAVTVKSPG